MVATVYIYMYRYIYTSVLHSMAQVNAMPKDECENLSAAVCFICALHLCNEKRFGLPSLDTCGAGTLDLGA